MKLPSLTFSLFSVLGLSLFFNIACESEEKANTSTESKAEATKIDHVDAAGAASLLASADKPVVLDIRTPAEFADGHIEGAKMIDFQAADFESKVAELDRDKTYLVHCQGGGRSTSSLPVFEKLGFKHVVHLDGGFGGWESSGQPVAK
ncbi:MAG: rhodanese-like domain-containing protein [Verrucomicrobiae bacterium]|nr:rhodanese-like domain-containing protein [Verrucomicrobiae bacterium]